VFVFKVFDYEREGCGEEHDLTFFREESENLLDDDYKKSGAVSIDMLLICVLAYL